MRVTVTLNEKSSIFSVISELSDLKNAVNDNIHLDIPFAFGNFIDAEVFVIINSIVNELRSVGKSVTISIDVNQNSNILNYASRINFFKHLGIAFDETFERHPAKGKFVEITHLPSNNYVLDDNLIDVFTNNFSLSTEALNSLIFVFDELMCNVTLHSQSQNGGYYFCQKYPNRNTVEIIIVDSGIGIAKSLNKAFSNYNEPKCLEECIKYEVTCGNGRGHGLFFIAELIRRNKGSLTLLSGESHLLIDKGHQKLSNNAYWDGTIVKCVFKLNNPLPIENLLNELNYLT